MITTAKFTTQKESAMKWTRSRFEPVRFSRPRKQPAGKTADEFVRFAALGGLEEVGRNMMFFEYKDEIVIIDMGLQFPEEDTPGIDYIIPNTAYLEDKKQNIRAVIITHAHYDHIGAIPYLLPKLGNPPLYAAALTKEIILKRQEDFPHTPKIEVQVVKDKDKVKLSENFEAEFFSVSHTIPDTIGVILKTPAGNLVHFAEMKFDYDRSGKPLGLEEFERIGKMGIQALFLDSTKATVPGFSISERIVEKNLEEIIRKAEGRVIVGAFASLLTRIGEIIKIAEKYDRRVILSGLTMKTNIQIAQNLGYIKVQKGTIIPLEEIHKYRDDKILILSTGAQGEPNASLMKIVNGENRHLEIKPGDTVIFSSSIIPGNERPIQVLKDNLARQGAKVYDSQLVDVHSTGHAPQEELKIIMKLIKPKFIIPIHGFYFMRAANSELAEEVKIPKERRILVDNGQVVNIGKDKVVVSEETVPAFYIMVDGLGVGDVGEVVMRDRLVLSQEGMIVVIATLDRRTGRFLKNPDIISRGFIYLRESKELVEEVRRKIRQIIDRIPRYEQLDSDYVKSLIRDQIGQFVYTKTRRRPMILPVVIKV